MFGSVLELVFFFKTYETVQRNVSRAKSFNIFPWIFFILHWFCPLNGNENYYSFHPSACAHILDNYVAITQVEGDGLPLVDRLVSSVPCTFLCAKISISDLSWLSSTSFPATVHSNGFLLLSRRWICLQSPSKNLLSTSHPSPLLTNLLSFYCLLVRTEKGCNFCAQLLLLQCTIITITM